MTQMNFAELPKLQPGDKVAVLSPSFAAPAVWPHVHELGLSRLQQVFGLEPVEYESTRNLDASFEQKAKDLIRAFEDPQIKAVIATLGGDSQILWTKKLPEAPFRNNPKPFFGYSDNTHFAHHLWKCGVPSYYGGSLFTEFAMQAEMDALTVKFLKHAFFESGTVELEASDYFNDEGLSWDQPETLHQKRRHQPNEGWHWDGDIDVVGITWGGCLESVDEVLRHGHELPPLNQFENIILFFETCEEIPEADYVKRFFRALGERGILSQVKAVLMGRPKAWEFGKEKADEEKAEYKKAQREAVLATVRSYNSSAPIVQNLDFGHSAPQICIPMGKEAQVKSTEKSIKVAF